MLLQPIYRVAIHAPAMFTGSLGPIVASHSGQVLGFDADPDAKGWEIFQALVPGSALGGLANDVRASTQGVGWFEAGLRPLRGDARQGRRPHRPGARQGAGLTLPYPARSARSLRASRSGSGRSGPSRSTKRAVTPASLAGVSAR